MNEFNKTRKKLTKSEIKRYLGDAKKAGEELEQYTKDCIYAESQELRQSYENKWVVVFENMVRASGPTLAKIMEKSDRLRLPRRSVVVKFLSTEEPPIRYFNF